MSAGVRASSASARERERQHPARQRWWARAWRPAAALLASLPVRLARRCADEGLSSSAVRLQAVVDTAVDGIIATDERGTIATVNPAVQRLFGYAPEELIGRNVRVLMPEPYRAEHDGYLKRYRRTGERRIIGIGREVTGRRKDGSVFPIELTVAEARIDGKRLFTGILRDVSERKQHEAALAESAARLRLALQAARKGMWEWKLRTGHVLWDARVYELLGLPVAVGEVAVALFFDRVHPEDRPGLQDGLARAIRSGEDFAQEFRVILPDGSMRWLASSGRVLRDAHDGQPARMLGVIWDVSERKRQEQALAESAARLRAVVDTAVDGILTIDEHGTIETANPAVAKVFGYQPEELVGQNVRVLMPEPYRREHDGYLERYRRTGERRVIGIGREVTGCRKDGTTFPVELSVAETLVGGKRLFTGIVRDISERKQAEERQVLLRRELNHRVKNILAVVQGVALLTGRRAESLEAFLQSFQGRLEALAGANELLVREGWQTSDLDALLRRALLPHGLDGEARFVLRVESLPVDAALAQNLALALHELATNAAKHGALSLPAGRVVIEAGPVQGSDGTVLRLVWREQGGPPVVAPGHQGFGTRLLGQLFEQQHDGRVALDWRADGLVCRIAVPLAPAAACRGRRQGA
jgi:PAS domain S-box-containing protein